MFTRLPSEHLLNSSFSEWQVFLNPRLKGWLAWRVYFADCILATEPSVLTMFNNLDWHHRPWPLFHQPLLSINSWFKFGKYQNHILNYARSSYGRCFQSQPVIIHRLRKESPLTFSDTKRPLLDWIYISLIDNKTHRWRQIGDCKDSDSQASVPGDCSTYVKVLNSNLQARLPGILRGPTGF